MTAADCLSNPYSTLDIIVSSVVLTTIIGMSILVFVLMWRNQ